MGRKQKDHHEAITKENEEINHRQESIRHMQKDNQEMMDQIKQDAVDEIREVEKKNQTNLNQVTDMSLRSKADLQITKNKLHDVRNELKTLGRLITDKSMQLDKQKENISNLNRELQQKKDQVELKDTIIH